MNSWKTTMAGLILAALVAIQPIIEGSGYHLDGVTITKLMFAGALAVLGYMAQDHTSTPKDAPQDKEA
jgi:hypothetical protein